MDGSAQQVSAPTTLVYRHEDGSWKLAVFHSIPLPEH
jgi:ketosteroid isomerase-like protein